MFDGGGGRLAGGGGRKFIKGDGIGFGGGGSGGLTAGGTRRLIIPLLTVFFLKMAMLPIVTNTMKKYNQYLQRCEKIRTLEAIKECNWSPNLCCFWENIQFPFRI
jgi:hypothetical protein